MLVKGRPFQNTIIQNILLIQLGDIGDVVWATPSILAVKSKYPGANVAVLVHHGFGSLLEHDPSIYKVFEIQINKGPFLDSIRRQLEFIKGLRQQHFDLVIDFRAGDRGAITSFLTGAPIRAAMFHRNGVPFWRNLLFTHLVVPPEPAAKIRGAAEQTLRIVRELGIEEQSVVPRLWVSEEKKKRIATILDQEGISNTEWISINLFSRWKYKEWVLTKWVEIADWLWDEYRFPILLIGSPEEKPAAEAFKRECRGSVSNLAGKTSLGELAALLSLSRHHIGVDSAAPHIAAAVGTPTITIYGPSDWIDWAPVGSRHRVITPDRQCAPCHKKGCNGTGRSECLEELDTEKVKAAIEEAIINHPSISK